jgi:NTE family protein
MASERVSLVLGSGGARGLVHIGVIDWLVENDYKIESISGCSMGALVGGIYAAGKLDAYKDWVLSLDKGDVIKMLDLSFSIGGLFKGEKIINKLLDLVGKKQIEELPVNFTAVATNIELGKEVWFTEGSLFEAIRASIAVPLVFTPVIKGKRILVDGGVINPVPIAPTMSDNTDLTIAVNVDGEPKDQHGVEKVTANLEDNDAEEASWFSNMVDEIQSHFNLDKKFERNEQLGFYEIITGCIETMQQSIAKMKIAAYSPDILLEFPSKIARSYEFYRAEELIKLGYEVAERELGKRQINKGP